MDFGIDEMMSPDTDESDNPGEFWLISHSLSLLMLSTEFKSMMIHWDLNFSTFCHHRFDWIAHRSLKQDLAKEILLGIPYVSLNCRILRVSRRSPVSLLQQLGISPSSDVASNVSLAKSCHYFHMLFVSDVHINRRGHMGSDVYPARKLNLSPLSKACCSKRISFKFFW
jgi:hypothetical protein